jgi:hypothetical protein
LLLIRHRSNHDSWGISVGTKEGILTIRKKTDFETFWDTLLRQKEKRKDILIHFRTATSGTKKSEGIQPIVDGNVLVFHNGNFPEYFGKKETDTVLWAKDNPNPLNHLEEIEKYCDKNGSRMAFMDSEGKVYLINKKEWIEEEGMWFSNNRLGTYSGFGYSGVNYYKPNEKRYF